MNVENYFAALVKFTLALSYTDQDHSPLPPVTPAMLIYIMSRPGFPVVVK